MFASDEIARAAASFQFRADYADVLRTHAEHRLGRTIVLHPDAARRLTSFVMNVLVSAPRWQLDAESTKLTRMAAEVAEASAVARSEAPTSWRLRLRAALLYELADQPMMAAAVVRDADAPGPLVALFQRSAAFKSLAFDAPPSGGRDVLPDGDLVRLALSQDAIDLAAHFHGPDADTLLDDAKGVERAVAQFSLDLGLTEVRAFEEVVRRRSRRATRHRLPADVLPSARAAGLPPELWSAQVDVLDGGLLDSGTSWGIGAPAGTGKTFLARMLVLATLAANPDTKVLYLVPSNALVSQITQDLAKQLEPAGVDVSAVRPQLVALDERDERDERELSETDVLILTPEKADLLLRIGAAFLEDVALVVVDEAHLIEDGTRGTLLEPYLMRLKTRFATQARYVLLSAVAPNLGDIARWVAPDAKSRLFTQRATRMRVGVYRVKKPCHRNEGWIDYTDETAVRLVTEKVEVTHDKGLAQLARHVGVAGSVLVAAKGRGTAESVASLLYEQLVAAGEEPMSEGELADPVMLRLDSRLEREMYSNVLLRRLVRHRVAYHHAGLPPRVREAVESAITSNHLRYVVATTTLGEGVNFPFSSVIVQSLSVRERPEPGRAASWRLVTPRTFWNIAGRAGRPGFENEGQVILFEPSLGLERVDAALAPYINSNIEDIEPVRSALATALIDLAGEIRHGAISIAELDEIALDPATPRGVQGLVNLVRVGIAHTRAADIDVSPADLFERTLAARTLEGEPRRFARELFARQAGVVDRYLATPGAPGVRVVAELGLSLETLASMQEYVQSLLDWQLRRMERVMYGPRINLDGLKYVVGPVLKRMAELEGRKLSGIYTDLVTEWCRGRPFSRLPLVSRLDSREALISFMYSQISYTLPWGLWAFDRFVAQEAAHRRIRYDHQIRDLAHLVDKGVPDFAAFTLVNQGFERTDAARLTAAYFGDRNAARNIDMVRWLKAQPFGRLSAIVRGADNRRIDYDFPGLIKAVEPIKPQ